MRRTLKAVLTASVLLTMPAAALASPTQASGELVEAYNEHTDREFRQGLQMRLAWTGDYTGPFTGHVGPETLRAIRDFQARNAMAADGVMTEAFLQSLVAESDRRIAEFGFGWEDDERTGVRVGLPFALVAPVGRTEVGSMWRAPDGGIEIETVRFMEEGYGLRQVFDILREPTPTKSVRTADFIGDHFILTGTEDGREFFIRFDGEGSDLRGFSVAYPAGEAEFLAPYISVAASSFAPFSGTPQDGTGPLAALRSADSYALTHAPSGPIGGARDGQKAYDASGTGFTVADGWLLTNAHVAKSCKTVMVGSVGMASEVIVDETRDLALLRVEGDIGEPLDIAVGKPRLGEDILALGFPLRSILADSLNVTRGNISSLLGLMNDPDYLQISAAVQPGNSGGPVIDLAGRVVGVVTAKLNAVAVADLTGDIPQSINFAIQPEAAARFLEEHDITFSPADADDALESVPDATAKVQPSIHPVLCLG
ncbi:serine protease [Aureimonas populi]|uniref:Trypsin-like peptidase domain-containing protein n=1 Tax=Aureimonas populi TaxID=1701758 RepID=A0ABW5CLF1_9HYPH|nr:serine protease [Aureimonas populi]